MMGTRLGLASSSQTTSMVTAIGIYTRGPIKPDEPQLAKKFDQRIV